MVFSDAPLLIAFSTVAPKHSDSCHLQKAWGGAGKLIMCQRRRNEKDAKPSGKKVCVPARMNSAHLCVWICVCVCMRKVEAALGKSRPSHPNSVTFGPLCCRRKGSVRLWEDVACQSGRVLALREGMLAAASKVRRLSLCH